MPINGVALATGGFGVVLLWSAVQNQHITTVLQDIIKGTKPAPGAAEGTPATSATTGTPAENAAASGNVAEAPATLSANEATAKLLAAGRGWTGAQWNALYALWTRESGFNNLADNATSGAYGIPQALPPTKMPFAAQAAGGSSPTAQINWGLTYIAGTYGNPVNAEAHEQEYGWY
jgi:hypothetical protein